MLRSRFSLVLPMLLVAGCDGPLTASQRLAGEWVGRPETAAERTLREWPGRRGPEGKVDPDDPEIVAAIERAPATDLETIGPVSVGMRLGELGAAELTFAGEQPLAGTWTVTSVEGRRAQLEITIDAPEGEAKASEAEAESGVEPIRRRFAIEFLREGEGFVLHEAGADPRFGRLLFKRADAPAAPPASPPVASTAAPGDPPEPPSNEPSARSPR